MFEFKFSQVKERSAVTFKTFSTENNLSINVRFLWYEIIYFVTFDTKWLTKRRKNESSIENMVLCVTQRTQINCKFYSSVSMFARRKQKFLHQNYRCGWKVFKFDRYFIATSEWKRALKVCVSKEKIGERMLKLFLWLLSILFWIDKSSSLAKQFQSWLGFRFSNRMLLSKKVLWDKFQTVSRHF